MTTAIQPSELRDAELVALSVVGERQAFETLVARHQGLVCALTFAGCGDIHQSEDLAQETFLQAWKHLAELRDRDHLRAWLCGIARNLTFSAQRKTNRRPAMLEIPGPETLNGHAPTPAEEAISEEERALFGEYLQNLPEEYREPMVLYYRQEESVAAVAAALEMSEVAVRQRLSRGRALLAQRMERIIRQGLRESGPTKAFTLAVIAALPGLAVSAKAATLSAAVAAKGGVAAKAASSGILVSSLLGPLIGIAGGYLGYRIGLEQAITPQERRFMRRFFFGIVLGAVGFTGSFLVGSYVTHPWQWNPATLVGILVGAAVVYTASLLIACFWYQRRIRQLRADVLRHSPEMVAKANASVARWSMEYRSRWTLLGLPLVHFNMGGTPEARGPVARGWIAVGGKAYGGLFAFGGIAVAPISFGGMSIGLLSLGGFALGAAALGGVGVGVWAAAGLALGWKALGGCAVGWEAAMGGAALAHNFAAGGTALARHANDAVADAYFRNDQFFPLANAALHHANWVWIIAVVPIVAMLQRVFRKPPAK